MSGSQPELPKNTVQEYLRYHKSFLEEYVMKDIPKETLEKWLYSKAQQDGTMGRHLHYTSFNMTGCLRLVGKILDSCDWHVYKNTVVSSNGRALLFRVCVNTGPTVSNEL